MTKKAASWASFLTGAAALGTVLSLVAATTPAQAATTYTPSGGPGISLVGSFDDPRTPDTTSVPGIQLTIIEPDQSVSCSGFSFGGSVSSPGASRAYGATAATLGTFSSSGCTNPFFGTTTITSLTTPNLVVTGDPVAGTWPARITNVRWKISWANCDLYVEGVVNGRVDPATQVFTPAGNPGSGASSYVPTGLVVAATPAPPTGALCATLDFQVGDSLGIRGAFTNAPPAGSTPMALSNP